jgi:hypothetical protein
VVAANTSSQLIAGEPKPAGVEVLPEALPSNIEITGPLAEECETPVMRAFYLMLVKSPYYFNYVQANVNEIRCTEDLSGNNYRASARFGGDIIQLHPKSWTDSTLNLAATIVHETKHTTQSIFCWFFRISCENAAIRESEKAYSLFDS